MGGFFETKADEGKGRKAGTGRTVSNKNTEEKRLVQSYPGNIITKLTQLRIDNYKSTSISSLSRSDYTDMQRLVLERGNKILQKNSASQIVFENAALHFSAVIEELFKSILGNANEIEKIPFVDKFKIVCFSAQLLQYNTIISDDKFDVDTSFEEFELFLFSNLEKFGAVEKNLFVTEYRLIKIYNDLDAFTNSTKGLSAPVKDMTGKIDFLLGQLQLIKQQIDQWLIDAPDNIFVNYLNFSANYSCAKAMELHYHLKKGALQVEEQGLLSKVQETFLAGAKNSLVNIDVIKTVAQDRNKIIANGMEFSLGQNVLIKLPDTDLESLHRHMSSLLR